MSDRSERLFERARLLIPGGVNSPARAFRSVGGSPRFLVRGAGARVWDEDGRDYLDYVCAWGPLLFGHAYAPVVDAVTRVAAEGVCFGAPTRLEVEYAEAFVRLTGWPEQVRVMNSGSEAAAVALRLARGATGRSLVLKFEGGYHGHADAFLREQAGAAPGVPASVSQDTIVAGYNDLAGVERVFERRGRDVAAVFVEPVAANMGVVPPKPGFLDGMRHVCSAHGALLVFDEVVTGFRLHAGGASVFYGVKPDLAVFGKIPGGGLPFGAVAGPRSVMEHLAPAGPVFHAGTFAGNPVTMAAGLAHLGAIEGTPSLYDRLEELGTLLEAGVREVIRTTGSPCWFARVGSMWTLFFTAGPVDDWTSASRADRARFGRFFHAMLERGVSIAPSQFEANFISAAHTRADIEQTVAAVHSALEEC